MPHLGVLPKHTRVRSSSSQTATRPHVALRGGTKTLPGALIMFPDASRPHAALGGATKTHPGALIVFPDRYKASCRTYGCYQNTPGCAHLLPRPLQGHMPHLGVAPKYARVRSSSSQTASRPHAALRGATKTHPGALLRWISENNVHCNVFLIEGLRRRVPLRTRA